MQMPEEDETQSKLKRHLCWAFLFHLLGLEEEAKRNLQLLLKNVSPQRIPEAFNVVCTRLKDYMVFEPPERIETRQRLEERSKTLEALLQSLGTILEPGEGGGSRLALECERCSKEGQAFDHPEHGYSRDPFKSIKDGVAADLALAAVTYLLRGYCSFFCRPRNRRDFNAAKVALNDLFQSGQIAWRLYRSLSVCHSFSGNQGSYLEEVAKGHDPTVPVEKSSYFVWSLLLMIEIQRGNVYRQIEYLDEASRFYRQARKRLVRVGRRMLKDPFLLDLNYAVTTKWGKFVTPTYVRALFEMSKVQFDLGYFLQSLMDQTLCLAYLVKRGEESHASTSTSRSLLGDLSKVMSFLDSERRQPTFDKESIAACYGYPGRRLPFPKCGPIEPSRFEDVISDHNLELAADIMARIGFTLFTLRRVHFPTRKGTADEPVESSDWPGTFFEANQVISTKRSVRASRFGLYCMTLVGGKPEDTVWDSPEKQFAHRLRESVDQKVLKAESLNERQFFEATLAGTTGNILNIATIPRRNQKLLMRRGYRFRREFGDLRQASFLASGQATRSGAARKTSKGSVTNKWVVLRRWQSTNPKFPRPGQRRLRGGGYFLLWQGKGIVVDPGYDFIQNFYDEGFSLEDIDAVLVTHSHPDHDDDLSTLTTLIREWNEYHESTGLYETKTEAKALDLFLNGSTNLKFSAWLQSSQVRIGRVIPLPSTWWDQESQQPCIGKIRGKPVTMILRNFQKPIDGYSLDMEIVPAWHDDVIGKTEAVGIKIHLYDPKKQEAGPGYSFEKVGILGYTGDTGAFGHDLADLKRGGDRRIEDLYADCDILVAHLGDIRLRELMTKIGEGVNWQMEHTGEHPVQRLFEDWLSDPKVPRTPAKSRNITPERVRDFVRFLIALDLAPRKALLTELRLSETEPRPLCAWLRDLSELSDFSETPQIGPKPKDLEDALKSAKETIFKQLGFPKYHAKKTALDQQIQKRINEALNDLSEGKKVPDKCLAWALLGFLCGFSIAPWQYQYHLGIYGLHQLFVRMLEDCHTPGRHKEGRVFIVGELPEELSSYRHHVARRLNAIQGNLIDSSPGEIRRCIHAFTGDIGLHVNLTSEDGTLMPKIRCAYCNYNNETLFRKENYHEPSKILEVPLKRLNSAMIYLCTKHDHYPEREDFPLHFLSRPNVRVV